MPQGEGGAGGQSDNSNNGNQNGNGGGGNEGSNGSGNQNQNQDAFSGLSQENREWATNKGWKALDAAFASHRELEGKLSRGEHKGNNQQSQHKLGDYAFTKPANAKDIGYQDGFAEWMKTTAHKHGVDPKIAAGLHDDFVKYSGELITGHRAANVEKLSTAVATTERELVKSFGGEPNTPSFKRSHELGLRAMRMLGMDGEAMGILAKQGDASKVVDAKNFAALAKIGAAMFSEDNLYGERKDDTNPFDPKTLNSQAQAHLFLNDPDRAEQLILMLPKEEQQWHQSFLGKRAQQRGAKF